MHKRVFGNLAKTKMRSDWSVEVNDEMKAVPLNTFLRNLPVK